MSQVKGVIRDLFSMLLRFSLKTVQTAEFPRREHEKSKEDGERRGCASDIGREGEFPSRNAVGESGHRCALRYAPAAWKQGEKRKRRIFSAGG